MFDTHLQRICQQKPLSNRLLMASAQSYEGAKCPGCKRVFDISSLNEKPARLILTGCGKKDRTTGDDVWVNLQAVSWQRLCQPCYVKDNRRDLMLPIECKGSRIISVDTPSFDNFLVEYSILCKDYGIGKGKIWGHSSPFIDNQVRSDFLNGKSETYDILSRFVVDYGGDNVVEYSDDDIEYDDDDDLKSLGSIDGTPTTTAAPTTIVLPKPKKKSKSKYSLEEFHYLLDFISAKNSSSISSSEKQFKKYGLSGHMMAGGFPERKPSALATIWGKLMRLDHYLIRTQTDANKPLRTKILNLKEKIEKIKKDKHNIGLNAGSGLASVRTGLFSKRRRKKKAIQDQQVADFIDDDDFIMNNNDNDDNNNNNNNNSDNNGRQNSGNPYIDGAYDAHIDKENKKKYYRERKLAQGDKIANVLEAVGTSIQFNSYTDSDYLALCEEFIDRHFIGNKLKWLRNTLNDNERRFERLWRRVLRTPDFYDDDRTKQAIDDLAGGLNPRAVI